MAPAAAAPHPPPAATGPSGVRATPTPGWAGQGSGRRPREPPPWGDRTKASRRGSGKRPPSPRRAAGGPVPPGRGESRRDNFPRGTGAAGGRRRQLLPKGRGSPVPLAASPKVAAGRGGGGGAGLIPGRAAAPPLRQPAGGLEAAAPPGFGCRGRAAPRLRPGQSRRQPLPAASVLDCSLLSARATSSGILERLLPQCSFISPSPLLSRTCSLSFSFHSFYPISACLPLLLPFSSFKLGFFLFPSLSPAPILFPFGPSYLVLLNFLISSDFSLGLCLVMSRWKSGMTGSPHPPMRASSR